MENPFKRFMNQAAGQTVERMVEQATETVILKAISDGVGDDPNTLMKRLLRTARTTGPNLQSFLGSIPGIDHVPNIFIGMLAEMAENRADRLWPGRREPAFQLARAALKRSAPFIRGVAEGSADALSRMSEMEDEIDRQFTSPALSAADRRGSGDRVAIIELPGFGISFPFVGVQLNDDGSVKMDDAGNAIVNDARYMEVVSAHVRENTTHIPARPKRGRTPAQAAQVKRPDPIVRVMFIEDWAKAASTAAVDPDVAERLLRAFTKPSKMSWWSQLSEKARQVLIAEQVTHSMRPGSWLDEEEDEVLIETMLRAEPDPAMVSDFLDGVRIDDDGTLNSTWMLYVHRIKDKYGGAEQSAGVKGGKLLRRIWKSARNGEFKPGPWLKLLVPVAAIPLVLGLGILSLLIGAIWMFGTALSLPASEAFVLPGSSDALSKPMAYAVAAGYLNFLFWTLLPLINKPFKAFENESLKSTGRKAMAYGFLLAGLVAFSATLGASVTDRLALVAATGTMICVGFMLKEVGAEQAIFDSVEKGAVKLGFFLGVLPIILVFGKLMLVWAVAQMPNGFIRNATLWLLESPWHMALAAMVVLVIVGLMGAFLNKDDSQKANGLWAAVIVLSVVALATAAIMDYEPAPEVEVEVEVEDEEEDADATVVVPVVPVHPPHASVRTQCLAGTFPDKAWCRDQGYVP